VRLFDLIALIAENLSRRKGRVVLTAIGVVIGTAAIVVLVSLAIGLQRNAQRQFTGIGDLTQIQVYPNYGEGGPMVMAAGPGGKAVTQGGQPVNQKLLTTGALKEIAAIPGVKAVVPHDYIGGGPIKFGRLEGWGSMRAMGVADLATLDYKVQAGTTRLEKGTAVVGADFAKNFMDPRLRPGQEPPPPPDLLDQQVRLTLQRWLPDSQTPVTKTVVLRVAGILAKTGNEADVSFFMNFDEATAFNEWMQGRRINRNKEGYNNLIVKVDSVDQVLEIAKQINDMGYRADTPQTFVQGINSFFLLMQVVFGGVGAVALLVAAIGIANTMTMAILERTREIGLMKAIGATNRDVLSVFLGEAAGIGLIGGLGGVLIGWGGGKVLNVLSVAYLAGQMSQGYGAPPGESIVTPLWLLGFALIFATLVGLLSGLYPALRAATLLPVTALKYE